MTAVTAPFDARAALELAHGVGLEWEVFVTSPLWPEEITLTPSSVELSEDETWWPRSRVDITCAVPEDVDMRDAIDPRKHVIVDVWATYVYSDEVRDRQHVASMLLFSREINNQESNQWMKLEAYCDEMLLEDHAVRVNRGFSVGVHYWDTANEAFEGVLELLTGEVRGFESEFDPAVVLPAPYPMQYDEGTVTDPVAYLRAWADSLGAVLYCDALGTWHLDQAPSIAAVSSAILFSGPDGLVTGSTEKLTRELWANRVFITYGQTLDDGTEVHSWLEQTPTIEPYDRVYIESRPLPPDAEIDPVYGFVEDPAINALFDRMLSRGDELTLTVVAHLWLHVGDTITVTTPTTPQQRVLVASIRTRHDGTQTITTRKP